MEMEKLNQDIRGKVLKGPALTDVLIFLLNVLLWLLRYRYV